MPTPPPRIDPPITNADGSTTVTTTEFHPNGNPRRVTRRTTAPDGDMKNESVEEFDRSRNAGPNNRGPRRKKKDSEYDDQGRLDKETETEYDRRGTRKKETEKEYDDSGRLDKETETEYDNRGRPKKRTEKEYDDNGNETRRKDTKYKSGRMDTEKEQTVERRNGRLFRKTVVSIKYCPDGERIKVRITQTYDWTGQVWRLSDTNKERWDCTTGRKLSLAFPRNPRDYALVGLLASAVGLFVAGFRTRRDGFYIGGIGNLIISAVLYFLVVQERKDEMEEEIELQASFTEDLDGEDEGFAEDTEIEIEEYVESDSNDDLELEAREE